MTIETSKTLGGVGALLLFLGILPYVSTFTFGILGLVGIILVFVALHGFASYYSDSGIFNNALYGLIIEIVGGVIAAIAVIAVVLTNIKSFLEQLYPSWNGSWSTISSLSGKTPSVSNLSSSNVVTLVVDVLVVLAIVWIFSIIAAFFVRRSLAKVSTKTSTGLFSTAGLLLLIGAFLLIIGIGALLIWIAALILAIAFFTAKTPQPQQPPMATMTNPPSPTPV